MNPLDFANVTALFITHASDRYKAESMREVFSLLVDICAKVEATSIFALVYPADTAERQLFDIKKATHRIQSLQGEIKNIDQLPSRIISIGGSYTACQSATVQDILKYWAGKNQSGELFLFTPAIYELARKGIFVSLDVDQDRPSVSLATQLDTFPTNEARLEKVKAVVAAYLGAFPVKALRDAKVTLVYRNFYVEVQAANNQSLLHYKFHAIHPTSYDVKTLTQAASEMFTSK